MTRLTTIALAVASSVMLSACSSTHSPEIQKSIDEAQDTFEGGYENQVKKYKPKRDSIGKIHRGVAYHDVNDYSLIQKDERKLPSIFNERATIKELKDGESYTVDEFAALIYESFGVVIDVSSPDLNMLADEKEDSNNSLFNPRREREFNGGNAVNSDSTGDFEDPERTFEKNTETASRDSLKLKSFSFDGTLRGLMDYVAQLNGLKWKYNPDFGKAYLYGFETRTFKIYDMGDDVDISSSITTDASQDSENTSGGSSKEFRRKKQVNTWEEVKTSIEDLISDEYGRATFNAKSGLVTVRDSDYNLAQIKSYVDELNKITTTQLTIEFKVIRFNYSDADNHGINQNYLNNKLQNNLLGSFDLEFGAGSLSPNISGNLGAFQEIMQGNFLSIANDSHQFLMGYLNSIGTAKLAYETQVKALNNETVIEQEQRTEEYIASIERSTYREGNSQENITTERDVAVDGLSLSLRPRIIGDRIQVAYSLSNSDFIGLKEAGLGAGLEGVKLKTQGALNLDNIAQLINGVPQVVKFTHNTESNTTSQGMFDDLLWFLGGNETRDETKSSIIVTMTAYYDN